MIKDEVVGMGRLVGDGVMYWYLQEIVVLPEYQGRGI
ncbi:MAG: GNAT family N-acetyltransferase [Lachnospiraceae bacterium]|nr:GNAT family N-acetyltransferase [Lachnospiraceae bacterium]